MILRLIFGDQLSHAISSLSELSAERDLICLFEVRAEATHVKHHKKKIAFLFSAMRHFAAELEAAGNKVHYSQLDDPANTGSFFGELQRILAIYQPEKIVLTDPSEYRVQLDVRSWAKRLNITVEIRADDRFLCSTDEFKQWASGRKQLRMEFFYREMRRKHAILMANDQPIGGQWNFDSDNRKRAPGDLQVPDTYTAKPDTITEAVLDLVATEFDDHFGDLSPFHLAVTRSQALEALDRFVDQRLHQFGTYQDAMLQDEPWMFHSHLSFYINCGLLSPLECIRKAEAAYHQGNAPLNAVEGFIRQLLGWREYVRGIYQLQMPDYAHSNFFDAARPLPALYWGQPTIMNCMRQCVSETKRHAYAHHIQRLMVLGNFALLANLDPQAVNQWYLIVYADAYEWVELPNVSGMVLFADGGLLASKPYAASGAYINKMSNYCKHCSYKVSQKNGPSACPFNYLYWGFMLRNRAKLASNPRLSMVYRTLDHMSAAKVKAIQSDNTRFYQALDAGEIV